MVPLGRPGRDVRSWVVTALDTPTAGAVEPTGGRRDRWRLRGRLQRLEDPLWGWVAAVAVGLLALGMRLWRLGSPRVFAFDETYYAKDAWSMANFGYVRAYLDTVGGQPVDDAILDGRAQGLWQDGPSMIVHPEVGKWLIALGEKAFGMDPFGWRVAAAVIGSLMIVVMVRLARRVTGSTLLGVVAGLLLSFDGLQFVLSRLALLDIFLAFFLLCGVACVVNDRDWHRRRMARLLAERGPAAGVGRWGPVRGLLLRPWLVTAGVMFGLALGTKWTAAYPLAAFGVLVWLWSAGARRAAGVRRPVLVGAVVDGVPAFGQLVLVALAVYVVSWTGWLVHADQYEEYLSSTQYTQYVAENPCRTVDGERSVDNELDPDRRWPTATERDASGPAEVVQSLRSLWSYHQDVYAFHTHFLNCSSHEYQSQPSGWPLINRPVGAATDLDIKPGEQGCEAAAGSVCYRQVLLIGTPVLWWGGALAMLLAAVMWLARRDWRYGLCVVGMASTWLPWLLYDDRPIFFFYAIAFLPFMVLAIVLAMGALLGPSRLPSRRRTVGVVVSGSFLVLVLLNFAYFHPLLSYGLLPRADWLDRMWFDRWI